MRQAPDGSKPTGATVIALVVIAGLAAATVLAAVTVFQLPEAVSEQGGRTTTLYQATLAISLLVFFGVTAGIIWAVFRYKRRGPELPEQIHGSSRLELVWTVIPVVILVALFIPSLILVIDLKTPPAEAEADLVVEVVGHQWWWEFIYPEEGIRIQPTPPDYDNLVPPALVVPMDKTVLLKVTSADVVHSFYAPNLLYKIQAVPGSINQMSFKAVKTGVYAGQCYQFCGLRHSDMLFALDVRSEADYQRWLNETKAAQDESRAMSGGSSPRDASGWSPYRPPTTAWFAGILDQPAGRRAGLPQ